MKSYWLTEEENADLVQALNASIHRLTGKITNDINNGRGDFNRVAIRKTKINRAKNLIQKITK